MTVISDRDNLFPTWLDGARLRRGPQGLGAALAEEANLPFSELRQWLLARFSLLPAENLLSVESARMNTLPLAECRKREIVPFALPDGALGIALDDPWDIDLTQWLVNRLGTMPRLAWTDRPTIHAYLESQQGTADDFMAEGKPTAVSSSTRAISRESIEAASSPVVRFVDAVVLDAWKSGASDIHFENRRDGLQVKLRLDGVLVEASRYASDRPVEEVLNRIKVLAQLDVGETRIPQDGRFRVAMNGRDIDLRVSIMPSIYGEDAVIRLLDKAQLRDEAGTLSLSSLGLPDDTKATIRRLARQPHGMLLVTGPTGSGKTTTLYSVLTEIHTGEEKIITIEDPVEYELAGALQIPVNEKKGLTFAKGLRSILRHDPDRILVGEIRDSETAEIAVQAALTGHLVLTSVHANNVYDVVGRFLHMGVDPYNFMSALVGVMAQRLVRTLCLHCAQSEPSPLVGAKIAAFLGSAEPLALRRPVGCIHCRQTGFKGRRAVAEVLPVDDVFREMVIRRDPVRLLREHIQTLGVEPLRNRAVRLVAQGVTTWEEVERVVSAVD
ncbi:GspE/PulE family protein [Pigmentiphaga sp. CHJ604]|uniref:GspE/PulE family protein n=1 Tax=Pigmentiphaga sp. CHJ604 TaxID=3081984 RepID=UPI0030D35C7D